MKRRQLLSWGSSLLVAPYALSGSARGGNTPLSSGSATGTALPETLPVEAGLAGKQLAMVVGNDRYQHNARLSNAGNDARLISQSLAGLGAEVELSIDSDRDAFRQRVVALAKRAAIDNAVVWFYYSGHGVQVDGLNYLQGVDADFSSPLNVKSYGVEVGWVVEMFSREGIPAAVVIVDACRNNPFVPETRGMDGQGLAPVFQSHGVLLAYSTAPFKKALDGKGQSNGPYAQALSQALSKRPQLIEDALRATADAVYASTSSAQIPWYQSSLRANLIIKEKSVALVQRSPTRAFGQSGGVDTRHPVLISGKSYRPDMKAGRKRHPADEGWTGLEAGFLQSVSTLAENDLVGYLKTKAAQGDVVAQVRLGEWLAEQRDFGEAFKWLVFAAQSGYPAAQSALLRVGLLR